MPAKNRVDSEEVVRQRQSINRHAPSRAVIEELEQRQEEEEESKLDYKLFSIARFY
jgi:hypothetical protein